MSARVIDGKAIAAEVRAEVAAGVAALAAAGKRPPGLAAVIVGDNSASRVYVRNKRKACEAVGIRSWLHELPGDATQADLLALVARLNNDADVHGILVQLPLPRHIDEAAVTDAIDPQKDVDGFHPDNVGRLATGAPRYLPCTPAGVSVLLARSGIATAGRDVAVVGRSNIVGKPMALILMQKPTPRFPSAGDATVSVLHSRSPDLAGRLRQADIVIAAVGVPRFVTADMVRPGATVIDVGINHVAGVLCGDVDERVAQVAGAVTPVPGGVGPMTIAMLLANTLRSAELHQNA